MARFLALRLSAPMISFGGNETGMIRPYPLTSMVTGLLGNALGYRRTDFDKLARLQDRLSHATRKDRGEDDVLRDFHTVTTTEFDHDANGRILSTNKIGTKFRSGPVKQPPRMEYHQGSSYTMVVTVDPADETPTLDEIAQAVQFPARPLFFGRKCCLPSQRPFLAIIEGDDLVEVLAKIPPCRLRGSVRGDEKVNVWWSGKSRVKADHTEWATMKRDWRYQIHTGICEIHRGTIQLGGEGS